MRNDSTVLSSRQRSAATDAVDDDRLTWDVPEAARRLGVSPGYYYRAAKRGELPVKRLGRRLVVPKAALLQVLEKLDAPNSSSRASATGGEAA